MKIKVSLHIHTTEDKVEGYIINYDVYQLIDRAEKLGFKVLGLTCHNKFVCRQEHINYAKSKGILLIGGIELSMNKKMFYRNDLIMLNVSEPEAKAVESINSFKDLAEYKKQHPEVFVLVPHPFYNRVESIGKRKLIKYLKLFDSIEHSWFYSSSFNLNKKAEAICKKFGKPFIATADAHIFSYLNTDYAIVETEKLDALTVFDAIKKGKFTNVTKPKKLVELIWFLLNFKLKQAIFYPIKSIHNKRYK